MKKVLIAIVLTASIFAAVPAFAQQFKVTDQVKLGGEGGWDYRYLRQGRAAPVHHSGQPRDGG